MGTRSFFQSVRRRWSVDEWADNTRETGRSPPPCRHCARVRWFVGGVLLAAALLVLHASAQAPSRSPPSASAPASKATGNPAVTTSVPSVAASASAASDATIYVATPRALPPRPEEPIASAALSAPTSSASAASSAGRDPMWLVYQTVALPSGRLDRPYKARDLVRGGRPPYRIAIDGALPPGMFVEEDGALAGTPTKTGTFRFLLTATDASRTRNLEQALYEIRIVDPKPAPAARPAAPAASVPAARAPATAKGHPPNPLTSITEDQTNRVVPQDPPMPMTYVLTEAKLADIFKNAEASAGESLMTAAAAGEAATDGEERGPKALAVKPPVMGPTLDQLREMLMPLKDVEHPTRAVFQDSLRARQCEYFLRHVNELTRELDKDPIERCPRKEDLAERDREPPPPRPSPGSGLAPDQDNAIDGRIAVAERERRQQLEKERQQQQREEKTAQTANVANVANMKAAKAGHVPALPPGRLAVDTFLDMLMPATLREEITDAAGVEHPMTGVKPLNLVPEDCGCSLQAIETDVYGFLPFWMQGASDAAIPVRFDKFTRMQYMGAVLRNDGSYQAPPGVESPGGGFARRVNQHDVGLDLVLYRRDFHVLMRLVKPARDDVLAKSAATIGAMLDIRHSDLQGRFEALLPPGWREEAHVYDGLTVFFEPTDEEAEDPRFERFFIDYVQSLVTQMQKRAPRAFHLNLVIPQHLLGEKGSAFRFRNLLAIMKTAERNRAEAAPGEYKERGAATASYKSTPDYIGTSPITVRILTPLGMGSDVNKMQLRNRTDFTDELSGPDRMALLVSVMPVLVYPGGKPVDFAGAESMDRDLVYIGWSFGGVSFWPLPVTGVGAGETVVKLLDARFWSFLDQDTGFCKIVCPMRMPLRLALEALLVVVGTTLLLYGWNCRVRRMGPVILMVLWAGGLITLAVASAIFSCDPSLNQLRTGNTLLVVIILVLIVGGLIVTFKPRVEAP